MVDIDSVIGAGSPAQIADLVADPKSFFLPNRDAVMNAPAEQKRKLIRLDKLLLSTGLADSATDGQRKIKQKAVQIDDTIAAHPHLLVLLPAPEFILRVGRKIKRVTLRS